MGSSSDMCITAVAFKLPHVTPVSCANYSDGGQPPELSASNILDAYALHPCGSGFPVKAAAAFYFACYNAIFSFNTLCSAGAGKTPQPSGIRGG